MTIEIRLGQAPQEKLAFALSPLQEASCALEALVHPRRHPLQLGWVLRTRETLPGDLWKEIRTLSFAYRDWLLGFFSPTAADTVPDFRDELAGLARMPRDAFVAECARAFTPWEAERDPTPAEVRDDPRVQAMLLAHAAARDRLFVEPCRQLVEDPEALRSRMVRMLGAFWQGCFEREWQRLRPRLIEDVERRAPLLRQSDVFTFFRAIAPDCDIVRRRHALVFRRLPEMAVVDLADHAALLLIPSFFTRVATRVECDPPWQPSIVYAAGVPGQDPSPLPPDGLQRVLKAVAHDTRMQILRLCDEEPRSTQELANALRLSEAAVSRHIKILEGAALLSRSRRSYYVLYRTARDPIRSIAPAMFAFLDERPAEGDSGRRSASDDVVKKEGAGT